MRQLVVALVLAASTAYADPSQHDKIDVSDAIGNVDVLRDVAGKYYIVPKVLGDNSDVAQKWTFYGDGRTMYRQRITLFSSNSDGVMIGVWAPRVRGAQHAMLEIKKGTLSIICRTKNSKYERLPLTRVDDDAAEKLLKKATFLPPLWERRVAFFGRGEGTTYFLVDMLQDEYGGGGYRLFVGEKGRMKPIAISDTADDSAGLLLATKGGELRITKGAATWKAGKRSTAVERIELQKSSYLIYRELGVYGQLGTFCEDQ